MKDCWVVTKGLAYTDFSEAEDSYECGTTCLGQSGQMQFHATRHSLPCIQPQIGTGAKQCDGQFNMMAIATVADPQMILDVHRDGEPAF